MELDIIDKNNYLDKDIKKEIIKNLKNILNYLDLENNVELCVSVIDDNEMRQLNKNYRNIDRTTDILSFPQLNEMNQKMLGDLVISYETALRHSKKYNISINQEIKTLLVHGILHLIGYDHKKRKETEIMRAKEKEIMELLV